MNECLEILLRKMCEIVNAKYDDINFLEQDWYLKYSWTIEQENFFKEFIIQTLKNNKKMQKQFNIRGKYYIKKFAENFVFNYGWRLSDFKLQ